MGYSPLNFTIFQYAALRAFFIGFGAALLAAAFCLISSALSGSGMKAYAACAAYLGAMDGYSFLANRPHLGGAYIISDITLWTRPHDAFSRYATANLFGYPVSWVWVYFISWIVIAAAIAAAAPRLSRRKPNSIA